MRILKQACHIWKRHDTLTRTTILLFAQIAGLQPHMNALCRMPRRRVTYKWISRRVTYEKDVSHVIKGICLLAPQLCCLLKLLASSHTWMRCVVFQGGMSHINENTQKDINENTQREHVTHLFHINENTQRVTYKWEYTKRIHEEVCRVWKRCVMCHCISCVVACHV